MKIGDWRERLLEPSKELLGRLTPSQRWSLAILGGVVTLGMGVLVFTSPSERWVELSGSRPDSELEEFLNASNVDYQVNDQGRVEVRAKDRPALVARSFETGVDQAAPEFFKWLYEDASLQETSGRFRARLVEERRRSLQDTLARFEGVKNGVVLFDQKENHGIASGRNDQSSAAVQLTLESGRKFSARAARNVGRFVSRSLNVPLGRVELTDQYGNSYDLSGELGGGIFDDDKRQREMKIRVNVEEQLEMEFAPHEFQVAVNLSLDRSSSTSSKVTVDDSNTAKVTKSTSEEKRSTPVRAMSPGTKANVALNGASGANEKGTQDSYSREETDYNTDIGRETKKSVTGPGEEKALSITVRISVDAIRQKIAEEKAAFEAVDDYRPTREDVDQFLAKIQNVVEGIPSLDPSRVKTTVDSFTPHQAVAAVQPEPDGWVSTAQTHSREIALGLLALVACALMYRLARGGVPVMEELPDPVAELEQFLRNKEEESRVAAEAAALEAEPTESAWENSPGDQEAAELLGVIGDFVSDNPDETASLIKVWLADSAVAEGDTEEEPVA